MIDIRHGLHEQQTLLDGEEPDVAPAEPLRRPVVPGVCGAGGPHGAGSSGPSVCGAIPAHLYPCGWRCEQHPPTSGLPAKRTGVA